MSNEVNLKEWVSIQEAAERQLFFYDDGSSPSYNTIYKWCRKALDGKPSPLQRDGDGDSVIMYKPRFGPEVILIHRSCVRNFDQPVRGFPSKLTEQEREELVSSYLAGVPAEVLASRYEITENYVYVLVKRREG